MLILATRDLALERLLLVLSCLVQLALSVVHSESVKSVTAAESAVLVMNTKLTKAFTLLLIALALTFSLSSCGETRKKCSVCNGYGYYQKKTCVFCRGTGYVS